MAAGDLAGPVRDNAAGTMYFEPGGVSFLGAVGPMIRFARLAGYQRKKTKPLRLNCFCSYSESVAMKLARGLRSLRKPANRRSQMTRPMQATNPAANPVQNMI
jgi:hypothetical protein